MSPKNPKNNGQPSPQQDPVGDRIQFLENELWNTIERCTRESDLTYSEVLGSLCVIRANLEQECIDSSSRVAGDDPDDDDDDDDEPDFGPTIFGSNN